LCAADDQAQCVAEQPIPAPEVISTCESVAATATVEAMPTETCELSQPNAPRVRTIGPPVIVTSPFAQAAPAAAAVETVERTEPVPRQPLPPGPPNRFP
jgi:hypothetical protein